MRVNQSAIKFFLSILLSLLFVGQVNAAGSFEYNTRLTVTSNDDGVIKIGTRYMTYYILSTKTASGADGDWSIIAPNTKLLDPKAAFSDKSVWPDGYWYPRDLSNIFTNSELWLGKEESSISLKAALKGNDDWRNSNFQIKGFGFSNLKSDPSVSGLLVLDVLRAAEITSKILTGYTKTLGPGEIDKFKSAMSKFSKLSELLRRTEKISSYASVMVQVGSAVKEARDDLVDWADASADEELKAELLESEVFHKLNNWVVVAEQVYKAINVKLDVKSPVDSAYEAKLLLSKRDMIVNFVGGEIEVDRNSAEPSKLRDALKKAKIKVWDKFKDRLAAAKTQEEKKLIKIEMNVFLASYALDYVGKVTEKIADIYLKEYKSKYASKKINVWDALSGQDSGSADDDYANALRMKILMARHFELMPNIIRIAVVGFDSLASDEGFKKIDYVLPLLTSMGSVAFEYFLDPDFGTAVESGINFLGDKISPALKISAGSFASGINKLSLASTIANEAIPFLWDMAFAPDQFDGAMYQGSVNPYGPAKFALAVEGTGVLLGSKRPEKGDFIIDNELLSSSEGLTIMYDPDAVPVTRIKFYAEQPKVLSSTISPWATSTMYHGAPVFDTKFITATRGKVRLLCARNPAWGTVQYAMFSTPWLDPDPTAESASSSLSIKTNTNNAFDSQGRSSVCGPDIGYTDLVTQNHWFDKPLTESELPPGSRLLGYGDSPSSVGGANFEMAIQKGDEFLDIKFENHVSGAKLSRRILFMPIFKLKDFSIVYNKEKNGTIFAELKISESNSAADPIEAVQVDWGDGTRSNELNHRYVKAGDYIVTLVATTKTVQIAGMTKTVSIGAPASVVLGVDPREPVAGEVVSINAIAKAANGLNVCDLDIDPGDGGKPFIVNTELCEKPLIQTSKPLSYIFAKPGIFTLKAKVTDSAGVLTERLLAITVKSANTLKLPATGITANQCYAAGSSTLVPCSSPAAIALSGAGKQDGILGGALSYSAVGSYSKEECVKDNATGLIWEGKTASGLRAGSNTYTNWGDGRSSDASGYVAAVNAQGLCGFNDWRLPTVDELQGIVDYSKPYPGPTVDTTWFPNTAATGTWSSSHYAGYPYGGSAWAVNFNGGGVLYDYRNYGKAVRLVRASQ